MRLTSYSRFFFNHFLKLHATITVGDALSTGPFKSDQIAYFMTKTRANSTHTAINMLGICGNNVGQATTLYLYMTAYLEQYFWHIGIGIEKVTQQMFEVKVWEFAEYMWERRTIMLAPYFEAKRPKGVARDLLNDLEAKRENSPLTDEEILSGLV